MRQKFGLIFLLLVGCSKQDSMKLSSDGDLLWQHCPAGQFFEKNHCRGNPITLQWDEALRYCAKNKMRLAKRDELLDYYQQKHPASLNIANLYWTSTTDPQNPELAWYLIPKLDWVYANLKELDGLVLCVTSNKKSS